MVEPNARCPDQIQKGINGWLAALEGQQNGVHFSLNLASLAYWRPQS